MSQLLQPQQSIFDNSQQRRTPLVWPGRTNPAPSRLKRLQQQNAADARADAAKSIRAELIARAPKAIKSRSSRRGSLSIFLRLPPKFFLQHLQLTQQGFAASPPGADRSPATALTKGGEPGGQSTGVLRQSEERSRGLCGERLQPVECAPDESPSNRPGSSQGRQRPFRAHFDSSRTGSFQPQNVLHVVKAGLLPTTHWAARNAPPANVSRLDALWVNSSRSPACAKMTVWSPTTSPPRMECIPISAARSLAHHARAAMAARLSPIVVAARRPGFAPGCLAVPLGASFFSRWCISTISKS